ncbi:MAG: thioredoxin domain-containing protein [bacterium]
MAHFELTEKNLEETIKNNQILFIDFWADWCSPCKMFAPVFKQTAERHPDIAFASCDTQAQPKVAAMFRISSIPTLAVFKEQVLVFQQAGALPESVLEEVVQKSIELDMDEVRKKIDEEQAKQATDKGPSA